MKWGYAVVPEHPHTPWGMWGSLVHHCNAHTDRSRHISVDSDPHPRARMTHRTARRGWFVDVLRVIWWCLRVFSDAWTWGKVRPSVWTIPCRYMAVEGFKMVTTHAHPPPPQHTAVGAGGRWWWCGLFLGWVWCSETPRSVVPSPLPLHTPSSRPSYVPPPPVSLAPNTHTHTHHFPPRPCAACGLCSVPLVCVSVLL